MLIIFDWDGTIADSWPVYKRAAAKYCAGRGLPLPADAELRHCFGNTAWEGLPQWGESLEEQDSHRFATYDVFYKLLEDPANRLKVQGIDECIDNCRRAGLTLAVATSRPKQPLLDVLDHYGWNDVFACLLTGDCVDEFKLSHKPSPDMIEWVLRETGIEKDKAIMIGDTRMDVVMAHNAGVKSVAVGWGMGIEDDLRALQPSRFCSRVDMLWTEISSLLHGGPDYAANSSAGIPSPSKAG